MNIREKAVDQLFTDLQSAKSYDDFMGKKGAIKKLFKASSENLFECELINPAIIYCASNLWRNYNIIPIWLRKTLSSWKQYRQR